MNIPQRQIDSLVAGKRSAYLGRIRSFLDSHLQRCPDDATLSWLFDRGRQFGLHSEQQLAGYILLAWACGCKPRAFNEPSWMSNVLNDPHRTADDKLDVLFIIAAQREGSPA